jgi:Protein of unknown function (DUF3159)
MTKPEKQQSRSGGVVTWGAVTQAVVKQSGGIWGMLVAAIPTVVFVTVNAFASLRQAQIWVAVVATLMVIWQLARRQHVREALVGLAVAGVCVAIAGYTGQAKGFLIVPILVPMVAAVACIISVTARRPITGVLFNRLVGGPSTWRADRELYNIYTATTLLFAAVNSIGFALEAQLYRANQTSLLAAATILSGPIRPAIIVVTIVLARRSITRRQAFTGAGS